MTIPAQIQAIDQIILDPLVQQATGRPTVAVVEWSCHPVHAGAGEGTGVYRFLGNASDAQTAVPWSLILKILEAPPHAGGVSDWNYWKREVHAYYSGLLQTLSRGITVPQCFAMSEQSDGLVWLWLEDISQNPAQSWSVNDYLAVAYQLGEFNSAYLVRQSLPDAPWLSQNWLRGFVEENAEAIVQLQQSLSHPWVRRVFPQPAADALLDTWRMREHYFGILETLPQTLCHLDASRRNLLLRPRTDGTRDTVAIDWAYMGHAALGEELVPLIVGSVVFMELGVQAAQDLEEQVLARYLAGLQAGGWQGEPRHVRLGYAAAGALRYGVGTLRLLLPVLLDEALHPIVEQIFHHPIDRLCDCWEMVLNRFTLRLADEALRLRERI